MNISRRIYLTAKPTITRTRKLLAASLIAAVTLISFLPAAYAQNSNNNVCQSWVAGTNYSAGDIVLYQGNYYVAEHANPGYIPTVSTWFWEPTSGASCGTSSSSVSSIPTNCPEWIAGTFYTRGTVVIYESNYYIAEHDNPGYIPTVSTYFWNPDSGASCETSSSSSSSSSVSSSSSTSSSSVSSSSTSSSSTSSSSSSTSTDAITINTGGNVTGEWKADANFSGGQTASVQNLIDTQALTKVPPQAALQSERWGEFSYVISGFTPNSSHAISLYFTENYYNNVGDRLFNVNINNQDVIQSLDILLEAGAKHKAIQKDFTIQANANGQYVMKFEAVMDYALINAIRIGNDGGNEETYYEAHDYTSEHIFTSGVEGPAVGPDGKLYAVNFQRQGTIGVVTPSSDGKTGTAALFVDLPQGSIGNGIRFNAANEMLVADYTGHNILKINMSTKNISVFAHSNLMSQPNDIAIAESGTLYASDPNWSNNTGRLWKIDTNGTVTLLEQAMGTTNGIEISADEKTLYVGESNQRRIWAYDILDNGNLSNKRLFFTFSNFGLDGMRCDAEGNLYVARYGAGAVDIISPQGQLLRSVALKGVNPTNIAFGGPDGKTVYVTIQDRGAIETFRSENSGRAFGLQ